MPRSQVRNGQLDKEAGELRDENTQLHRESERLRSDVASGARVCPSPIICVQPLARYVITGSEEHFRRVRVPADVMAKGVMADLRASPAVTEGLCLWALNTVP